MSDETPPEVSQPPQENPEATTTTDETQQTQAQPTPDVPDAWHGSWSVVLARDANVCGVKRPAGDVIGAVYTDHGVSVNYLVDALRLGFAKPVPEAREPTTESTTE